jgi:hypothetical protein
LIRFIGIAELVGALGLILPAATRVKPFLTPVAAGALALVMLLAAGTHAMYGEMPAMIPVVVLGAMSAFVAWGRMSKRKIEQR